MRLSSTLVLFAGTIALLSAPAPAAAEPSTLIATASDSGTKNLGSGFDTGVARPKKMVLKVKVKPNQRLQLEYQVACNGHGERVVLNEEREVRSRRIRLPLLVGKPSGCLVYAFGDISGRLERETKFRIELRAKSRGYQPPPPEPVPPEDVRAHLKVEPRVVGAPARVSVRAVGRDAGRFITGVDLRLDRPDPAGGWEPAYFLFASTSDDGDLAPPIPLPPTEPIYTTLVGYDPTFERFVSLEGVAPGAYRMRMDMSPNESDRGFPDNFRIYRELEVQP